MERLTEAAQGLRSAGPGPQQSAMLLYALTIFLSAFLLFQVQPIAAKLLLPWFGGSAAVWTTCLLFFQVVLLLGYGYAHWLARSLRPGMQTRLHVALLVVSALVLPFAPKESWKPLGTEQPTLHILLLLAIIVGLPYFLLSTTGPLLQAWYAARTGASIRDDKPVEGKSSAYRLYALSNAGSMAALITYPVLVEPALTIRHQLLAWSLSYVVFAVLCGAVALRAPREGGAKRSRTAGQYPVNEAARPGGMRYLFWLLLAACSSTLLLAVTHHLTQNVAAIPFLWLLPLSLYLLSFILCFGPRLWQWNKPFLPLPVIAMAAMLYGLAGLPEETSPKIFIPLFSAGLLVFCLMCHGELARSKPHPQYLTAFYLTIAFGGALGGMFVALLAPYLFRDYYELPIALGTCAVLALFTLYREPHQRWWDPVWLILCGLTAALLLYLASDARKSAHGARQLVRNFYGSLRVSDSNPPKGDDAVRTLTNGVIIHGEQFLDPRRSMEPTTYYAPNSGVGLAIHARRMPHERVGVIGLGTGTLASHGRPGDEYRFYEINPLVLQLARTQFSFLKGSAAKVQVVLGDARLSLEREPKQDFDVLAVDAFSSDSIPVHLLTREAFHLYFHHLKSDGVLAVHVSNRYVDLVPVVARAAGDLGKEAGVVDTEQDDSKDTYASSWVLLSGQRGFFQHASIKAASRPLETRKGLGLWTDEYSSLFPVLK